MKNFPKPTSWDTKGTMNIKAFITEYKTYCDTSEYNSDKIKIRIFGYLFKNRASIMFAASRNGRAEVWGICQNLYILMFHLGHLAGNFPK